MNHHSASGTIENGVLVNLPFHQSFKNFVGHGESKLVESPSELLDRNVALTVNVHRFESSEQDLYLVLNLNEVAQ